MRSLLSSTEKDCSSDDLASEKWCGEMVTISTTPCSIKYTCNHDKMKIIMIYFG